MRTIVSTLQTASYGPSNYLAEFIEPILNKNKHSGKKPSSFENKAATWETTQEHIQVSNDVINSYSSIAIDKAITVLIETLNNHLDHLNTRTNLILTDIRKLMERGCFSIPKYEIPNQMK